MAFKSSSSEGSSTELNFIGKGTFVNGEIFTESNLRIDGKVKGKVVCKNTLTIGETGQVEGEVEATSAIVGGKVNGKLFIKQKLVLESKSSLIGELKASKLIIDEGAIFQGISDMGAGEKTPQLKSQIPKQNEEK
ncbi:MAG: polymer-forming cytoskeletal protein [Calditrichaeota bacterium]|nr:polymer-forming cytoskeletal protein [Calditrichota bacterium]